MRAQHAKKSKLGYLVHENEQIFNFWKIFGGRTYQIIQIRGIPGHPKSIPDFSGAPAATRGIFRGIPEFRGSVECLLLIQLTNTTF